MGFQRERIPSYPVCPRNYGIPSLYYNAALLAAGLVALRLNRREKVTGESVRNTQLATAEYEVDVSRSQQKFTHIDVTLQMKQPQQKPEYQETRKHEVY